MTSDLVSVVVPVYNKADHLQEALDSVLAQVGVAVEVVVVDDRSTDGSWELAQAYASSVRLHRLPENTGGPHARNVGASLCRGEYLMFLDADDALGPGALAALRDALVGTGEAIAVCGWKQLRLRDGEWVATDHRKDLVTSSEEIVEAWLGNRYFPPCAMLWRRGTFVRSGGWDETLLAWQDTDLVLRTVLTGVPLVRAEGGEAFYRFNPRGTSVSSRPGEPAVRSRVRVLDKLVEAADQNGSLGRHRVTLGRAYLALARGIAAPHPELKLECLRKADRWLERHLTEGPLLQRTLVRILGLERKEKLKNWFTFSAGTSRITTKATGRRAPDAPGGVEAP